MEGSILQNMHLCGSGDPEMNEVVFRFVKF